MRSRHRKRRGRRRLDGLLLDMRTARWLGRRLWRPTLQTFTSRARR